MDATRVFISYSQDSDDHRANVRRLVEGFRHVRAEFKTARFEPRSHDGWTRWLAQARASELTLAICTPKYHTLFINRDYISGVRASNLDRFIESASIVPTLLAEVSEGNIPQNLRSRPYYRIPEDQGHLRSLIETRTIDVERRPLEPLVNFLLGVFNESQLRRWIQSGPDGLVLTASLPGENASPVVLASDAVQLMLKRGYLDSAFFTRLTAEVPRKGNEIKQISELFGVGHTSRVPSSQADVKLRPPAARGEKITIIFQNTKFGLDLRTSVSATRTFGELASACKKHLFGSKISRHHCLGYSIIVKLLINAQPQSPERRLCEAGVQDGHVIQVLIVATPVGPGVTWDTQTLDVSTGIGNDRDRELLVKADLFSALQTMILQDDDLGV